MILNPRVDPRQPEPAGLLKFWLRFEASPAGCLMLSTDSDINDSDINDSDINLPTQPIQKPRRRRA
jgi:hypothetical protein